MQYNIRAVIWRATAKYWYNNITSTLSKLDRIQVARQAGDAGLLNGLLTQKAIRVMYYG